MKGQKMKIVLEEKPMIFEALYLLARFRGIFPDNQKGTLTFGRPDKETVRQMYYRGGFIPYRIDSLVAYR